MSNAAHLDDILLNEYLDAALDRSARTDVEAHVAHCPECSARLMELRTLFADLESLPDLTLERDLTPAVLAVARRKARPQPLASPALGLVFALQAVVSVLLLGVALLLFAPSFQSFTTFQFGEQVSLVLANLLATLSASWSALLTAAQNLVNASATLVQPIQTLPFISEAGLMICLSAVFLLWLLGNGLLLRPRQSHARPQE
jgi:anti-sigma factor RsiW